MGVIDPQPKPKPTEGPDIWDLVISDMKARDEFGTAKYGVRLKAGDGRDSLKDAYQEFLDGTAYIRKAIEDRDEELNALRGRLADVRKLAQEMPHEAGCEARHKCRHPEDIECEWADHSYADSCSTHNEIECTCLRARFLAITGAGE